MTFHDRYFLTAGFTTKLHIVVDGLGNPLRFVLTGGQRHDITQVFSLIDGFAPDYLIADRGSDADAFLAFLAHQGTEAVIPARKNRKETRTYDVHLYKEGHLAATVSPGRGDVFCTEAIDGRTEIVFSRYTANRA